MTINPILFTLLCMLAGVGLFACLMFQGFFPGLVPA
jgi:hypothetical protein